MMFRACGCCSLPHRAYLGTVRDGHHSQRQHQHNHPTCRMHPPIVLPKSDDRQLRLMAISLKLMTGMATETRPTGQVLVLSWEPMPTGTASCGSPGVSTARQERSSSGRTDLEPNTAQPGNPEQPELWVEHGKPVAD